MGDGSGAAWVLVGLCIGETQMGSLLLVRACDSLLRAAHNKALAELPVLQEQHALEVCALLCRHGGPGGAIA